MRYSVLDLFRSPLESAHLAQQAERLGFHRYWIGEHHDPRQCPNPLLLAAVLLGITDRIRIGSGALGLLVRSPVQIAEDAQIIESLYQHRFDLGITRGLAGANQGLRERLLDGRSLEHLLKTYPERVRSLAGLLDATDETPPRSVPPLWLVGVNTSSACLAASLGIGFCTSLHHQPDGDALGDALDAYRRTFVRGSRFARPYAIVVQSGVCAPTSEEAQALLDAFLAEESPLGVAGFTAAGRLFVGDPKACRASLEATRLRYRPDEIMLLNLLPQSLALEERSLRILSRTLRLRTRAA